jgi:hypothetical protein
MSKETKYTQDAYIKICDRLQLPPQKITLQNVLDVTLTVMRAAESVFAAGTGEEKKHAVLDVLERLLRAAGVTAPEELVDVQIPAFIDLVVNLSREGVFPSAEQMQRCAAGCWPFRLCTTGTAAASATGTANK